MKVKRKKRMTKSEVIETNLLNSAIAFIEYHGGKVLVIGGLKISQRELKYNFSLEIPFTGKPPNET